ncbi:hypothetical protein J2S30_002192 [Herbaspirillum rubrisubalbicans]|uniref:hypothetical protein n=1 Tax=Herbaspirillum rubrisubalbicans TaxID=80842 RepID=UPI0020A0193B|nr:hypothetical protein [Herbaspirillum rubrisubalbicans]MCP1573813.1 hypothetical protein [Herbaspirillum rubrisubalbicans]
MARLDGLSDMRRSSIPGIRTGLMDGFLPVFKKTFQINGLLVLCRSFCAGTKPAI